MAHISSHHKIGNKKNSTSNNDALYVYTQNNAILKGLSSITNEDELMSFCSKIKSKPEELYNKVIEYDKEAWTYSPLSENGSPIYQNSYINFIGLAYFLNNQFLTDFFKKQIGNIFQHNVFGYSINKYNYIVPIDFKEYLKQININKQKLDTQISLLNNINNDIKDIIKYKNMTFNEIYNALIFVFHDEHNNAKINFLLNYKESGANDITFNESIKNRIQNNIYYYDHNILPICVDILNLDILKDPIVLKNIGKSPIFADKILSKISYKDFKKIHKQNFFINATQEPHYDNELLNIFIKHNILDSLFKQDKEFLNRYFTGYRVSSENYEQNYNDLKKIFIYLKDKYNYEYLGFYRLKDYKDKIYMTPGKDNKNSPLQTYILANNLKNMPNEVLEHFIKTFIAQDQPDYFFTIFSNPDKNITNEEIYLTFLKSFGEDKRIKYFSSEKGIETIMTWLTEEFRTKHNINVSDTDIIESLKNNEKTNSNNLLGVHITKYLLDNVMRKQENVHNISLPKKRL